MSGVVRCFLIDWLKIHFLGELELWLIQARAVHKPLSIWGLSRDRGSEPLGVAASTVRPLRARGHEVALAGNLGRNL